MNLYAKVLGGITVLQMLISPATAQNPADFADPQSANAALSMSMLESAVVAQTTQTTDPQEEPDPIPAVSQLSDVQPQDWAFTAVQSLGERYGCLRGYRDQTFRGDRAVTRFELAAALNHCLEQLSQKLLRSEDLVALKALQQEFAAELTALRGRVETLEARTTELEAQQFSTTTQLSGTAVTIPVVGAISGEGYINPTTGEELPAQAGASVIGHVKLSLYTSFRGSDLLDTSIAAGNDGQDFFTAIGFNDYPEASGNAGQPFFVTRGTHALSLYPSNPYLYRLAYTFQAAKDVAITVGPQLYPNDFIDTNSYANNPYADFSSYFFTNNPLIIPYALNFFGGAGGAIDWNIGGGPVTLRAAYVAVSGFNAIANQYGGGLLGDPYQGSVELEYARSFGRQDKNNFAVRLQYTNSATFDVAQNVAGLNFELTLDRFALFGRYGYSAATASGLASAPIEAIDFTAQTWMVGAGVKDLFVPGSFLGAAIGQPFINNLPQTVSFGPNNATQTNYEAFFQFPLNENISLTPTIMVITGANNTSGQPALIQGALRTTFSF